MVNLQETLLNIAKAIVDSPDEVQVFKEEDDRSMGCRYPHDCGSRKGS
jgi:predicted RNA-binding protein YlqC (UPF0109 family)